MAQRSQNKAQRQAFSFIKSLERPPGVTVTQWRNVVTILKTVARWQPDCYFGQERFAQEASMTVRSIQRYTALAQELGLLIVIPDAGVSKPGNPSKTHRYSIPKLPVDAANLAASVAAKLAANTKGYSVTLVSGREENPGDPSDPLAPLRRASGAPTLESVGELSPEGNASAALERANAAGYIKKRAGRGRTRDPDVSRRLVSYFFDQWDAVVLSATNQYKDVREVDSIEQARGYLRSTFFEGDRVRTENEVRSFIDEFMKAVLLRQARIKPGQSAFKCFTGWWGRRKTPAYNPSKYDSYRPLSG